MTMKAIGILLIFYVFHTKAGILYPRTSLTREIISLDGLWKFSLNPNSNFDESSLSGNRDDKDIHLMPVPSSYNDIGTSAELRDHLGPVKYQRSFTLPKSWKTDSKVWIRFGSVCYSAKVYLNGVAVVSHEIGHLPFSADITGNVLKGQNNLTVIVDNTLNATTVPQGGVRTLSSGRKVQTYTYDFFNYAGIDRPVVLYRTPTTYVDDITITTDVDGTTGIVKYKVDVLGKVGTYKVSVLDSANQEVASSKSSHDTLKIANANLWWPYLMHEDPGYQYTLKVQLFKINNSEPLDVYEQPFGIRKLHWDNTTFTINGKPIYFRGMGRHEDSDIRGKGLDQALILRDHNLLRWLGANSYRTSHYPYAEEIMDLADKLGIMIIDEVPAVNTENFSQDLLENHKRSISQLYRRDKNRPSVVIWSVANEPRTQYAAASDYYKKIAAHIRFFDQTRPITIANNQGAGENSGQYLDILSFNIYEAWYSNPGALDVVKNSVIASAQAWHNKHNKPVLVTEYGADTLSGLHSLPSSQWSEEYQAEFLSAYAEAFDELRRKGWFIGEMIWNFADFKTPQGYTRVGGNKKGIFTRDRQPKASAHLLRKRYWQLAQYIDKVAPPTNLEPTTIYTRRTEKEL